MSIRLTLLLLLLSTASFAVAQPGWIIGDGTSKPGETGLVEVRFHDTGVLSSASARVHFNEVWLRLPPHGTALPAPRNVVCTVHGPAQVHIEVLPGWDGTADPVACRIPVTPASHAWRRSLRLIGSATCLGVANTVGPCPIQEGKFVIDGPAHWIQRAVIVVPRPGAPDPATLSAFDYANETVPAPLRMFETPRPRNVAHGLSEFPWPGSIYAKAAGPPPNAAVAGLLRSVRAIYRDEADRAAALGAATHDPVVEGVLEDAGYGLRTYPGRPRAGEPFALWLTTNLCTSIGWRHIEDRRIDVSGGRIDVIVPLEQSVDFATCPGGEAMLLWNMPGLAAGQYDLRLRAWLEDGWFSSETYSLALTVLPQGSASAMAVRAVPAFAPGFGVALVLLLAAGAKRAWRRRVC